MRSRRAICALAALAIGALVAPTQAAATPSRGTVQNPGRSTTVRSPCQGIGRMVVTAQQAPDGSVTARLTTHGLVDGELWNGSIHIAPGDDPTAGAGGTFHGRTPVDGSFTDELQVFEAIVAPVIHVQTHEQGHSAVCRVTVHPETQSAVSLCRLSMRRVSMTAIQRGGTLALSSRLRTVTAKSRWSVSVDMVSPHSAQGFAESLQASAGGIVHAASGLDYAVNRTISIAYANRSGHGCRVVVGTHRLPA